MSSIPATPPSRAGWISRRPWPADMREHRMTALLLAPAMAIFAVLFVVPLAYFFVISFWRKVMFAIRPDFTFVNYGQVFDQNSATLAFTLGLAFVVAALTTALGFIY